MHAASLFSIKQSTFKEADFYAVKDYINAINLKDIMETLNPLKIQNLKRSLLIFLCAFSLQTLAQGMPKAYNAINYQGKINGRLVKFILADGYIGASFIKMGLPGQKKPLVFEPEADVADVQNRLKFIAMGKNNSNYFILDNMQDAYEETPAYITGVFFLTAKKYLLNFDTSYLTN